MNHEQKNYSTQSLSVINTPTQSLKIVSSPNISTPKTNLDKNDYTGWTPYFAEEYSVFNETPGRLTNTEIFPLNSPSQKWSISQREPVTDLGISSCDLFHKKSIQSQDTDDRQVACSWISESEKNATGDNVTQCVTPKSIKIYTRDLFTGQTVTPPESASKTSRSSKLKSLEENVRGYHQNIWTSPAAVRQNIKPFLLPAPTFCLLDSCLGKDVNKISTDTDSPENEVLYSSYHEESSNSYNWSEKALISHTDEAAPRPCYNNTIQNPETFDLHILDPRISDPKDISCARNNVSCHFEPNNYFLNASISGVNPGLLISRKSSSSMSSISRDNQLSRSFSRKTSKFLMPYEHQRRESIRNEKEKIRQRSFSQKKRVRKQFKDPEHCSKKCSMNCRHFHKTGQGDDVKPQEHLNVNRTKSVIRPLTSSIRTEVRLSVDSRGRARIETITTPRKKRRSNLFSTEVCSNKILSHKNLSLEKKIYNAPPQRINSLELSRPKSSQDNLNCSINLLTDNFNEQDLVEPKITPGETKSTFEQDIGSGDAALELRKMIESRKRKRIMTGLNDPNFSSKAI